MKKSILLLISSLIVLSCIQEQDGTFASGKVEFNATFGPSSKAVMVHGTEGSSVEWTAGDKVSVLIGEDTYLYEASSSGPTTTLTTEATDVPASGTYYALFPYDSESALTAGKISTTLPSDQQAVLNSFTTHLAVAATTTNTLSFKNVCGLVRVNIDASDVSKIVFEGNSDEVVSGGIDITVSDTPSWTATAGKGQTKVTLLPASGSSSIAQGDYYFAVLPQTFSNGFKVTAYKGETEWVVRNVTKEVTIRRASIVTGKPFVESVVYPVAGGEKVKTLQTSGYFTQTAIKEGITHYHFAGDDQVSGANQNVNVLEIDLDNPDYEICFSYVPVSDSTSSVAQKMGAIAAINGTYELESVYLRTDGVNHSEVGLASDHLKYWKHNGAIVGDGGRKVGIVNGAGVYSPSSAEGGDAAIALYGKLQEKNLFSGAPMLIDDYSPIGEDFVPGDLTTSELNSYDYEDYRRHQGVRHPRTAVALTEDNDLLLIVVDGRGTDAQGMSAKELTGFIGEHFNPRWALNLDGGGSSTMYIDGYGDPKNNVLNYPTDNDRYDHYGQRRVRTHILVRHARATVEGTESSPYLISDVGDMIAMREKALPGETTYFRLENNIDMSSVEDWEPVNHDGFYREIHFDGNGKTLSNFSCSHETNPSLFGVLYGSCKNLTIDGALVESSESSCGVIAAKMGDAGNPVELIDVVVKDATVTSGGAVSGGICGSATNAIFTRCDIDVALNGSGTDLGGFVGKVTGEAEFTDCDVKVVLVSTAAEKNRCGGFIGWNSSTKTVITRCNVLAGSSLTDNSGRTTVSQGNYGGFIGYGDTDGTVLKISGSSSDTDIVAGKSYYNSAFIGGVGYASSTTLENCHATGDVSASGNYLAGLVGRIADESSEMVIKNCSYSGKLTGELGYVGGLVGGSNGDCDITDSYSSGTITATGNYVGGIIGAAMNAGITVSKSYSTATISSNGQRVGGIVGTTTAAISIDNCYSAGSIYGKGQQVAGILGYSNQATTIKNCFVQGDITSDTAGSAGILGTLQTTTSSVTGCIVWSDNIVCNRADNTKWAPGAIIGAAQPTGTYKACWRNPAMNFVDKPNAMVLVDHEDIENSTPLLPSYAKGDNTQRAYHGKAAAAGATISSLATTLGWSTDIWDLSGDVPVLK